MHSERTRQFFHLFMPNQNKIYAYILTYVSNVADADDIMQETASVIWEKFETFRPGTDFAAWARKIAYNKILNYRKRVGSQRVIFSDDLLRLLENEAEATFDQVDAHLEALKVCIRRLSHEDRRLVRLHYEEGITIKGMAEQANRSIQGLYKVMVRIHDQLRRCVHFRLISKGVTG